MTLKGVCIITPDDCLAKMHRILQLLKCTLPCHVTHRRKGILGIPAISLHTSLWRTCQGARLAGMQVNLQQLSSLGRQT